MLGIVGGLSSGTGATLSCAGCVIGGITGVVSIFELFGGSFKTTRNQVRNNIVLFVWMKYILLVASVTATASALSVLPKPASQVRLGVGGGKLLIDPRLKQLNTYLNT